jgi:hypothetical protein
MISGASETGSISSDRSRSDAGFHACKHARIGVRFCRTHFGMAMLIRSTVNRHRLPRECICTRGG